MFARNPFHLERIPAKGFDMIPPSIDLSQKNLLVTGEIAGFPPVPDQCDESCIA